MNLVLEWVKANLLIVIFVAIMLAAAIGLPMISSGMNAGVRQTVAERAQNVNKLAQLEKSEILPGVTGVPNEETLARYEQVANPPAEDAARIQAVAIEHNRKGRTVLMPDVFPEPPQTMIDVVPKRFHEALTDAYGALLNEVQAGSAPPLESLREALTIARTQFITQDLKKDPSEQLSPEETQRLTDHLSGARMAMYSEAAQRIKIYVPVDVLNIPAWNQATLPSIAELFVWQWQYWIQSDVLKALAQANRNDPSVLAGPVKRVLYMDVRGLPGGGTTSSQPRSGTAGAGGFGAASGIDEGMGAGSATGATSSAGMPADPKAPVTRDYKYSITGRKSNPLYDVIYVDLAVIVETARLPQMLDALSQYNFMTVTALEMKSADAFEALRDGYFYGSGPVAEVALTLETVWLRVWTQEFMPPAIKQALGVSINTAGESSN